MANKDISICYLGQSGFLLRGPGLAVVIDPYLSYAVDHLGSEWKRNYPPPFEAAKMSGLDLVLCTHEHPDHTDMETLLPLAKASPACQFGGPAVSVATMTKAGIDPARLVTLREGEPFHFRGVTIESIPAAHEVYETDAYGHHLFLSYLIRWEGLTFFHAGDTLVTSELRTALSRESIDVAFLPVNGRSAARRAQNIAGNMNADEALELASDLNFGLVVPIHYDLYDNNGAPLSDFIRAWEAYPFARRPRFKAFLPGEEIIATKASSPFS